MFKNLELLYFKMALLHLFRRRGRSILISLMIAISLIGLLLMEGMYEGMMLQLTQNSIKTGSGTLVIEDKKLRADPNIKYNIKETQTLASILDKEPLVSSYVLRISQKGLISTAGFSQGVSVSGVDLKEEAKHSEFQNYITSGEYSFGARERGAIIGYRLAKKLKVDIGKKVIVTMQDVNNEVVSVALKVSAIIKTNNIAIDANGLLMDINLLRSLTMLHGATEISVLLKNRDDDLLVKQSLEQKITDSNIAVYSYKELYPSLHESEAFMQTFSQISSAFIFIVATLGIFGVVLVSVLERVREFGIMMAIGTQFRDIVRLIIYESLLITMSGYLLGAVIGGSLLWYFSIYGLDLSGFSDAFSIFGMDSNIKATIKQEYFTSSFLSVLFATIAATIIPIRTLKKRNPIESIQERV
ncbi:MAG: FtsX-like permease family protein [Sulfurimonas sp.]|nr:FtsX-like permease family protein [Sulfurimonas sp.]